MTVFLATLGQRPEVITMALDALLPRYHYDEIVILHTDAERSGIAEAYAALMRVLKTDYSGLKSRGETLSYAGGQPLTDISDQHSAEAYYQALLEIIRQYRVQYILIHLLVAGGRKAMSIYAALAAGLLFGEHDRLWTIHTPPELMQAGLFHAPTGMQDRVQMNSTASQSISPAAGCTGGRRRSAFVGTLTHQPTLDIFTSVDG